MEFKRFQLLKWIYYMVLGELTSYMVSHLFSISHTYSLYVTLILYTSHLFFLSHTQ